MVRERTDSAADDCTGPQAHSTGLLLLERGEKSIVSFRVSGKDSRTPVDNDRLSLNHVTHGTGEISHHVRNIFRLQAACAHACS